MKITSGDNSLVSERTDARFRIALASNVERLRQQGFDPGRVALAEKLAAFDRVLQTLPAGAFAPAPDDLAAGRKIASRINIELQADDPNRTILQDAADLDLEMSQYHSRGKLLIRASEEPFGFILHITLQTST